MNEKELKIHITGASGSGTTTLGKALAKKYDIKHFDTDDFFWEKTTIPFSKKKDEAKAIKKLKNILVQNKSWILTGSLCGWGDFAIKYFDFVIFLYLPKKIRIERLVAREIRSFGKEAISKGGDMYEIHKKFIDWAKKYDTAGMDIRSRRRHEAWLSKSKLPVLRIEGDINIDEKLEMVEKFVKSNNLI